MVAAFVLTLNCRPLRPMLQKKTSWRNALPRKDKRPTRTMRLAMLQQTVTSIGNFTSAFNSESLLLDSELYTLLGARSFKVKQKTLILRHWIACPFQPGGGLLEQTCIYDARNEAPLVTPAATWESSFIAIQVAFLFGAARIARSFYPRDISFRQRCSESTNEHAEYCRRRCNKRQGASQIRGDKPWRMRQHGAGR